MYFKVVEIIDGDTFKVSPKWKWNNQPGNIIRPNGYDTPEKGEPGYQEATQRLRDLIFQKQVELKNAIRITYGRLLCDVYVNGKNLADCFKDYQ